MRGKHVSYYTGFNYFDADYWHACVLLLSSAKLMNNTLEFQKLQLVIVKKMEGKVLEGI